MQPQFEAARPRGDFALCEIAGFTYRNGCPDPERIRKATATLGHRGPDQIGVFGSSSAALGAAGLKIIDLETGDQPPTTADRDATSVFNGEIYDLEQLRAELEQCGYRFRTHCDTEIALYWFVEWNTDCFTRLRGVFALAVWTESSRTLVLARDRMAIKPLYVARWNGDLFFGSELKAILIHPQIEGPLSLAGLDCYVSLNYVPSPLTLVEGIEKLAPGSWLKWRDDELSFDAYWKTPSADSCQWTLDEAKEELDLLLKQSVSEHLVSSVPAGLWLRGGIDSSILLRYLAARSSAPIKTFSISFAGRGCAESRYVRQVAGRYGTEHSEYDLNPDSNLRDTIEEFAYYSDEPSADAGALPIWYLSERKLVLTKKQAKKHSKRKISDSHAYVAGRKA
jgi:asparagine synthase (glutamine-hydrolysing)